MSALIDLTGRQFGRLHVIGFGKAAAQTTLGA